MFKKVFAEILGYAVLIGTTICMENVLLMRPVLLVEPRIWIADIEIALLAYGIVFGCIKLWEVVK